VWFDNQEANTMESNSTLQSFQFQHPAYVAMLADWKRIDDITRSRNLDNYLLELNPTDKSVVNKERNRQYKLRAIFYAIASQSAHGMVGSMYTKWPELVVPAALEYMAENVDGAGVSIFQQSQSVASSTLRKGRAGLSVAFPETTGEVKAAQIQSGEVAATIHEWRPEQIINWRVESIGTRSVLVLVVLYESAQVEAADGFALKATDQYRVMRLEAGVYRETVHRKNAAGNWVVESDKYPKRGDGAAWDHIPFFFVGSENNDVAPDDPPFLPLVNVNVGHFRNSADYEDSVWYSGQAQPFMTGVTKNHLAIMKEHNMYAGSREVMGVPAGETYGYAQPSPNTLVHEAMGMKVELMVGLGARLVERNAAAKTATQASGEREAQHSVLSLVASNVSEAYTKALVAAGAYTNLSEVDLSEEKLHYTINQEFVQMITDPNLARVMMEGYAKGQVPLPDYVAYMKRNGLFGGDSSVEDYSELLSRSGGGEFE